MSQKGGLSEFEKEYGPQSIQSMEGDGLGPGPTQFMDSLRFKVTIEILEQDARPTFIVNLDQRESHRVEHLPVLYHNPALSRHVSLRQAILESTDESANHVGFKAFLRWIRQTRRTGSPLLDVDTHLFHEVVWTVIPLQDSLIISGLPRKSTFRSESIPLPADTLDNLSRELDPGKLQISLRSDDSPGTGHSSENGSEGEGDVDVKSRNRKARGGILTRIPQSAHIQFFHSIDWASTELGPISSWSDELLQMCAFIMADPGPAYLFVGQDLLVIHNDAGLQFFPQVERAFMGSTIERCLPQIWASFGPLLTAVRDNRQVVEMNNVPVLLYRGTNLKEVYVSYRYIPIENSAGDFLAIYETASDVTKENLSRRRLATLLEVSTCSNQVTEQKVFWDNLLHALSTNKQDIGFALLYSLEDAPRVETDPLDRNSRKTCALQGTLGITKSNASVEATLELEHGLTGFGLGLKRALDDDAPVLLQIEDGTLPSGYLADVQCRGFSSSCDAAVVLPIRPTGGTNVAGFLIVGVSSRVEYDSEFRQFIEILNRQIATSMAAITLFTDEICRERKRVEEATLVHAKLQARLEKETQALLISETKFDRLTDAAPVGISITNGRGEITYANEAWYKLMDHKGAEISAESWLACLHEDDVQLAVTNFGEMLALKEDREFEIRLKKPWIREIDGAEPIRTVTWVIASAYVIEDNGDGQGDQVFGVLTDISAQKWAEETHRRKMVEALELKAQQESFIDTISHEMRNPLSAILQSVDEITEYLSQTYASTTVDIDATRSSIEAVDTIALCCHHQRRVIDDVLTLSKMNTKMLQIAHDENDPLHVVRSVVRIFSGDAKKQGISLTVRVEDSMQKMAIDRLLFDPGRLSQVLVNLLGNAIKFTRDSDERQITVIVGTSASRPPPGDYGIFYVEPEQGGNDSSGSGTDDEGRKVCLRIVVQDTGIGMTDEEKQRVFKRFAQASPRTHIRYGGSGLGLFISKRLTELQGGAIGLKMGKHKGTTFAFYITALRPQKMARTEESTESTSVSSQISLKAVTAPNHPPMPAQVQPRPLATDISILVVEDNLVNQKVMCRQLRKKGYIVYTACHGLEALEFLEQTRYWKGKEQTGKDLSVILLDIEMPIMDGLTCIRKIRQLEVDGRLNGHIPVVSVSANARHEQVQDARIAGMNANISKPFRIVDLIPVIESLLGET